MKVKETPWEKRNLGVDSSVEFYFEEHDEDVSLDVLNDKSHSYQVAHIPVGKIALLNLLLKNGFQFSETKFELIADLKNVVLPKIFERFSEEVSYHEANQAETEKIYSMMKSGIFSTDKVALDPHFNAIIAGKRYAYWTEDEIKLDRAFIYMVTEKMTDIGFFVLKKSSERLGDSFLAGLFNKDSGLGFSVLYFPMIEAKRMGLRKMITGVSSNNPDSVKMHLALGYQIKSMDYTLVKHV